MSKKKTSDWDGVSEYVRLRESATALKECARGFLEHGVEAVSWAHERGKHAYLPPHTLSVQAVLPLTLAQCRVIIDYCEQVEAAYEKWEAAPLEGES